MNTGSVNNPASYLERQQKRIDNIVRITVALLSDSRYHRLTYQQVVNKAVEIYDIIAES